MVDTVTNPSKSGDLYKNAGVSIAALTQGNIAKYIFHIFDEKKHL